MITHLPKLSVCLLGVVCLSSCVVSDEYSAPYRTYTYDNSQLYPQADYRVVNYGGYQYQGATQSVSVPDSYHVGEFHAPVSFKDRDKNWVSSQNPQSYTIEIAHGEKAAQVAQKLYKAPRSDRMAQVKYQEQGKSGYRGVYGSYPDAQSAQKALDALPAEIKNGAGVKNWGSIQGNLE